MTSRAVNVVRVFVFLAAFALGVSVPVALASETSAPASAPVAAAPADSATAPAGTEERKNGTTEEPAATDGTTEKTSATNGKTEEPAAPADGAMPGCDPNGNQDTAYERPATPESPFRSWSLVRRDITVFAGLLAAGVFAVVSGRRRVWFFGLLLASAAYLGFYRHGCVCSVGSIGNVAHAAVAEIRSALHQAPPAVVLPVEAVVFFVLPLLVALVWGRVFCGTVCPLGAVQHFLARKSLRVPRLLDRVLRIGPWLMLVWALVSAWVWLGLPICRLDPFVPVFRLTAHHPAVWCFTGGALLLCVFVARPYCRWLCPYGALLGLVSRLAIRPRRLDAGRCVRCNRCAKACPIGAIQIPPTGAPEQPKLDFAACVQCGRCSRACGKHAVR